MALTWAGGLYLPNKYNAKRTKCLANHTHHSGAEARRCDQLMLLFRAQQIQTLEIQPRYALHADGIKLGEYVADFAYFEGRDRIVEDVKGGPIPPLSKWKIKHAEAQYKFKVRIVREK